MTCRALQYASSYLHDVQGLTAHLLLCQVFPTTHPPGHVEGDRETKVAVHVYLFCEAGTQQLSQWRAVFLVLCLQDHVVLVCDNCMEYNQKGLFYDTAEKLKKWAVKKINTASKKFLVWCKKNVPKIGASPGTGAKGKQNQNPNKRKKLSAPASSLKTSKKQKIEAVGRSTPTMVGMKFKFSAVQVPTVEELKRKKPEALLSNMQVLKISRVTADTAREKLNEMPTLGQMCNIHMSQEEGFVAVPLPSLVRKNAGQPTKSYTLPPPQPRGQFVLETRLPMTKHGIEACCVINPFNQFDSNLAYNPAYGDQSIKAYCDSMRKFADATGSQLHRELVEERINHVTFGGLTGNPGTAPTETVSLLAEWDKGQEAKEADTTNTAAQRTLDINGAYLLELSAKLTYSSISNPDHDQKELAEAVVRNIQHLRKVKKKPAEAAPSPTTTPLAATTPATSTTSPAGSATTTTPAVAGPNLQQAAAATTSGNSSTPTPATTAASVHPTSNSTTPTLATGASTEQASVPMPSATTASSTPATATPAVAMPTAAMPATTANATATDTPATTAATPTAADTATNAATTVTSNSIGTSAPATTSTPAADVTTGSGGNPPLPDGAGGNPPLPDGASSNPPLPDSAGGNPPLPDGTGAT